MCATGPAPIRREFLQTTPEPAPAAPRRGLPHPHLRKTQDIVHPTCYRDCFTPNMANSNLTPITVAHGDGIGPEIMGATLHILKAAGARLAIETIEVGEKVYLTGNTAGIEPSAWESLRRTKVFLKAPITTPQGGGYKSLNVTARKTAGPVREHPAVRFLSPLRPHQASRDGRSDRPRKRRRSVRRHRVSDHSRRDAGAESHYPAGHRKRSSATPSNTRASTTAKRSPASPKTTS